MQNIFRRIQPHRSVETQFLILWKFSIWPQVSIYITPSVSFNIWSKIINQELYDYPYKRTQLIWDIFNTEGKIWDDFLQISEKFWSTRKVWKNL